MTHESINIGDAVIYIPHHLLREDKDKMIVSDNIGTVTSKNDRYVFVRYINKQGSEATNASDLFSLNNRPDLIEILEGGK